MARRLRFALGLLVVVLFALARTSDAQTSSNDPAARGLDVFVHAPGAVAPNGVFPVQVEALGFPTIVSLVPLAKATVEAVWNPESLGDEAQAPPPVKATTDAEGRAHLDVPMPDGDEAELEL